jgi:alkyldihydroxyacetonephosphate synthase
MKADEPANVSHEFLKELEESKCFSRRSFENWERIMHSHGASLREVFALRYGRFERYVDMVLYPGSTEHVKTIVELADKHNVVLIPYGGGTNVTQALFIKSADETVGQRMLVSLDMSRMDKVMWVDKENSIACVQAGMRGIELEKKLKQQGVVSGHEPDSSEFSTMGGWISTRASGMKKNTYGNIEDIVQGFTFVTPKGVYKKSEHWPRVSAGPDFSQAIMGQEGNFGVVTEAIIKVKPVPEKTEYGSYIFPNFEIGIQFMEEMSK